MLRARGLVSLIDVARQASAVEAPLGSAAALQQLLRHCSSVPAAAGGPLSAPAAHIASDGCQLRGWSAPTPWRGLHTSAAAAAAAAAGQEKAAGAAASSAAPPEKVVLYRGKGMRLFRLLVRCGPDAGVGRFQQHTVQPQRASCHSGFLSCPFNAALLHHAHARRLKVFQLAGIAALAVPINTFLATGDVESTQVGHDEAVPPVASCLPHSHMSA